MRCAPDRKRSFRQPHTQRLPGQEQCVEQSNYQVVSRLEQLQRMFADYSRLMNLRGEIQSVCEYLEFLGYYIQYSFS